MLRETDLPCSDCGADLVERAVTMARRVDPVASELTITVAECPECGARYFPERSLTSLRDSSNRNSADQGR